MGVLGSQGGKVLSKGKDLSTSVVKADGDKGVFPLKIREPMLLEANNFLRKKGLFPEDDSDDDEMVFGDDDFPRRFLKMLQPFSARGLRMEQCAVPELHCCVLYSCLG